MTEQVNFEISGELLDEVRYAVESGQYASTGDVALEALRSWRDSRDDVEPDWPAILQAWDESVARDEPGLDPEEVFARLRARYAEPADQPS